MIEEVRGVIGELARGVQRQARPESIRRTFVENAGVHAALGRAAPLLVSGELAAPAKGVPDAGVIGAQLGRALDEGQAFVETPPAGDVDHGEMFECFDVIRIERECPQRQRFACGEIVGALPELRLTEEFAGVLAGRQRIPSTSPSASCSVKTRNELVRTLPWPLTASATRVIVSSSGASAMTT